MPHVVLVGPISVGRAHDLFEPFERREGDLLIKAERFYRERRDRAALVEMVVVERGRARKFFIQLTPREDGLTVRLEPLTDPEKTPGVRRALATVAHHFAGAAGCAYGPTNIEDYLIR